MRLSRALASATAAVSASAVAYVPSMPWTITPQFVENVSEIFADHASSRHRQQLVAASPHRDGELPLSGAFGGQLRRADEAIARWGLKEQTAGRAAAVMVPLCNRHGVASMLFTRRSTNVSSHKGEVSFPGGHWDPGETWTQVALRETWEEIGLTEDKIQVLGQCAAVPAKSGKGVTPILGFLHQDVRDFEDFQLSADEVAAVFTIPLHLLTDGQSLLMGEKAFEMEDLGPRGVLPFYVHREDRGEGVEEEVGGKSGGRASSSGGTSHRVWGMTAYIASGVLHNVVLPAMQMDR